MKPLPIFVGYDAREEIGLHVFNSSVLENTTCPVSITFLHKDMIQGLTDGVFQNGSNHFTTLRFLVPWLMDYKGVALFCDGSDMVATGDLCELIKLADPRYAVQVVKHNYKTKFPRKYRGTTMECDNADYHRKQWASVMLMNCSHSSWRGVGPHFVQNTPVLEMLQLRFLDDNAIGDLPMEWNWLADEMGSNTKAKILHYTAGIPAFDAHKNAPMSYTWRYYRNQVNRVVA